MESMLQRCQWLAQMLKAKRAPTFSHSLIPWNSVVSASCMFSVSSSNIDAYRSLALASCRGESLLLCIAASRQASPVETNFWYSLIRGSERVETIVGSAACAFARHSSPTWTSSAFVSAAGLAFTLFVDRAGEACVDVAGEGLVWMAGDFFGRAGDFIG